MKGVLVSSKQENRCWPGYEPVPGKKPHAQGSCRPKAESKSTTSEKEFKSKRRQQLDKWEKKHPQSRPQAAQHLGAPDKASKSSGAAAKGRAKGKKTEAAKKVRRASSKKTTKKSASTKAGKTAATRTAKKKNAAKK